MMVKFLKNVAVNILWNVFLYVKITLTLASKWREFTDQFIIKLKAIRTAGSTADRDYFASIDCRFLHFFCELAT